MIVLDRCTAKNFLSIKECDVPLAKQGVVLLRGRKYATVELPDGTKELRFIGTNGTAKTGVPDILRHLIFQTTSRGTRKDDVVRGRGPEGFEAALYITKDEEDKFKIQQTRKHHALGDSVGAYQWHKDDWKRVGPTNQTKAQKYIHENVIEYTEREYIGCISAGQATNHFMIEGDGAGVRDYLSRLFGIDEIDRVNKALIHKLAGVEEQLAEKAELRKKFDELNEKIDGLPPKDELTGRLAVIDSTEELADEKIAKLNSDKALAVQEKHHIERGKELRAKLTELGWDGKEDCSALLRQAVEQKAAVDRDLQELNTKLDRLGTAHEFQEELDALPPDTEAIDPKEIEGLAAKKSRIEVRIAELEERKRLKAIEFDQEDLDRIQTELTTLDKRVGQIESSIDACYFEDWDLDKLGQDAKCTRCGSVLSREHIEEEQATIAAERKELAELLRSRSPLAKQAEILRSNKAKRARLDELEPGSLKKASAALANVVKLLGTLKQRDKDGRKKKELTDKLSQYADVRDENAGKLAKRIRVYEKTLEGVKAEITRLEEMEGPYKDCLGIPKTRSLEEVEVNLNSIQADLAALAEARQSVQDEKYQLRHSLDQIAEYSKELATVDSKMQQIDVEHEHKLLKTLIKVLPHLKKRKLRKIVEGVRDVLPRYAQRMFQDEPSIRFELDDSSEESINILCVRKDSVNSNEEERYPIKGMSIGEKARLNVCFIWTLHDLLRPTKQIDFLCLDEVDLGLDSFGLNALVSLIEERRASYGTILVISNRDVIEGIDADQNWVALKIDGESTIVTEEERCLELLTTAQQS
jgi:DNA repair exonuclease SbcCD ATPase subunit